MRRRSLRNTAFMIVGALVCVQGITVALERQARPTKVDPAFYTEVQEAQRYFSSTRIYTGSQLEQSVIKPPR